MRMRMAKQTAIQIFFCRVRDMTFKTWHLKSSFLNFLLDTLADFIISVAYLACLPLICHRLFCALLGLLHVVGRLFDVGFDPINHLPLQEAKNTTVRTMCVKLERFVQKPWFLFVFFTWASTSMARYWNMSCRSLMLFSSFRISSCRDSISFSACFVALASIRICRDKSRWTMFLSAAMTCLSNDNWFCMEIVDY